MNFYKIIDHAYLKQMVFSGHAYLKQMVFSGHAYLKQMVSHVKNFIFIQIFLQVLLNMTFLNFSMAFTCKQPVSGVSTMLTGYTDNDSKRNLSTRRVPCRNSLSLATGRQCGASGKQKKWTKFTLNKHAPEKSQSKRNELSVPKEQYDHNGGTVTYRMDTIIPEEGVYRLDNPEKAGNTALVFFQIKGNNGFSPALAARIRNDGKLCITKDNRILKRKPNGETYYESVRTELYVGDMEGLWGKPLKFEFQVHFDPNENGQGFINGNLNGRRIFSHRGPVGFHAGDPEVTGAGDKGYYAKFGIYNSNRVDIPEEIDLTICHSNFRVNQKIPTRTRSPGLIKASYEGTDTLQ